jgi:hypothetical protein
MASRKYRKKSVKIGAWIKHEPVLVKNALSREYGVKSIIKLNFFSNVSVLSQAVFLLKGSTVS